MAGVHIYSRSYWLFLEVSGGVLDGDEKVLEAGRQEASLTAATWVALR
jgi:hypothetical protein